MKGTSLKKDSKGIQDYLGNHFMHLFTFSRNKETSSAVITHSISADCISTNTDSFIKKLIHLLCIDNYKRVVSQETSKKKESYYYNLSHNLHADHDYHSMATSLQEAREVISQLPDEFKLPYSMYKIGRAHV